MINIKFQQIHLEANTYCRIKLEVRHFIRIMRPLKLNEGLLNGPSVKIHFFNAITDQSNENIALEDLLIYRYIIRTICLQLQTV